MNVANVPHQRPRSVGATDAGSEATKHSGVTTCRGSLDAPVRDCISSVTLPVQVDGDGNEYVMHPTRGKVTKKEDGRPHKIEFRPLPSEGNPPLSGQAEPL
jgi:hypothetical protein